MSDAIQITDTEDRRITAHRDGRDGDHLALILPGLRYGCDKPLLAGAAWILRHAGADVVRITFDYQSNDPFLTASDTAQLAKIEADGRSILAQVLADAGDVPVTLIGKSLGTISMGGMLGDLLPKQTRFVWLTPSLLGTPLLSRIRSCPGPSFSLIGARDPSVGLTRHPDWVGLPGMTHYEVAGMDHGWQHSDGSEATTHGLAHALAALSDWLDRT